MQRGYSWSPSGRPAGAEASLVTTPIAVFFHDRTSQLAAVAQAGQLADDLGQRASLSRGLSLTLSKFLCASDAASVMSNMTISLAFLAPRLVRAAAEACLPRGINIERLRDAPGGMEFGSMPSRPGNLTLSLSQIRT